MFLLIMKVRLRLFEDCEIRCMCSWLNLVSMLDSVCSIECMLWLIRVIVVYGVIILIWYILVRLVVSVVIVLELSRFLVGFSDMVMLVLVELIRFIDRLCCLNWVNMLVRKLICCYMFIDFIDIRVIFLCVLIVFMLGVCLCIFGLIIVFFSLGWLVFLISSGMCGLCSGDR